MRLKVYMDSFTSCDIIGCSVFYGFMKKNVIIPILIPLNKMV